MKIFQVNFLSILLFLAVLLIFIGLPSFFIQSLWNSTFQESLTRNMHIEIWQAALLWGAFLSLIYATGIFKFKIDFKSLENIDIDSIDDPALRNEIERLRDLSTKKKEKFLNRKNDPNSNQDTDE